MEEDRKEEFFEQDQENAPKDEKLKKENVVNKVFSMVKSLYSKMIDAALNFDPKKINYAKIKKNYIWILLGVLILTFLLAHSVGKIRGVLFGEKKAEEETVAFQDTIPVKVYKVKPMDFKDTLPVMGRIEGKREIDLMFDGKGNLESINFEEGERILEGDIIASLEQEDALLKLKYAALELEKNRTLYDLGGVDKLAVDQKKLEYESAKRDLEKTNLYAASDGYLGSKEKSVGAFVTTQDKIGVFVDTREVYARFDVIEEDSSKIKLGQNVEIFLDAYPGTSYTGTVDMVSPMIEGRTRTQKVKVELENEENKLKPGMFARAIINTYEKAEALIIPASSFKKVENKYFVYIVHPEEIEKEETGEEEPAEEVTEEDAEFLKAEEEMTALEEDPAALLAKMEGATKLPMAPKKEEEEEVDEEALIEEDIIGIVEEREIKIEYLTHDVAEVGEGLVDGELIIRELHQEYKNGDRVEITEIQETLF